MTPDQVEIIRQTIQYTNSEVQDVVSYQAASWYLGIAIFTAVLVLIVVVGVLLRPRENS